MSATKITIAATVAAPVAKVWDCWTQPEHITQWNFASPDWHCPSVHNDLRPGGKYGARMEARDGSMGFDFEAVYDEVIPHQTITYTMGDGRQATTTFTAVDGQTTVTTVFDAEDQNPAEMQKAGWQAILNNFKGYVEGL
ncbi:MAG: SRPBCC family protein [Lewinella sp.]|nr:SRPBCC family protein [Lewinella sp.]